MSQWFTSVIVNLFKKCPLQGKNKKVLRLFHGIFYLFARTLLSASSDTTLIRSCQTKPHLLLDLYITYAFFSLILTSIYLLRSFLIYFIYFILKEISIANLNSIFSFIYTSLNLSLPGFYIFESFLIKLIYFIFRSSYLLPN